MSLEANTVHESLRNIINTVGTLAEQSVAYVSQTYVDNLKKEGKFNAEEQEIAMRKAVSRLEQMVDEESQEVLRSVFGNLAIYFETLIEAAVRDQNQPPLVVIEEPTEGQV